MPSRLTVVLVSLLVATPAVIFWLWLVILRTRVLILCPEGCWCDTEGYYVECSEPSLNNVPLTFPTGVQDLLLYDNNITSLENDSFISTGLTDLEKLTAEKCEIRTVEVGAFNGLTKLMELAIWRNEISEIIPGTFEKMGRLKRLFLSYNRIQHLDVDVFRGLVNLKYIDLRSNKFQYLHPDTFVGLPSLEDLDLAQNPDLQIPTDRHFVNSHSLSSLGIAVPNVNSVSVETFANVTALERLDLSYNNLSSVDINILKVLPKLSVMYLSANPLQCDCQLQEVWRWCQEHNIQTAFLKTAPECDTPSEVQGMWWGVLEKGQCLQDDISYYGDYKNTSYSYTPPEDPAIEISFNPTELLKTVQVPVYAVAFIFGTTGNVILLIIITCNKDMRTVPNMYILNLAISNMIYLTVHFSDVCVSSRYRWRQYGKFMCKFIPFCSRLSVGLSAYSVAVLSIQRYRVTVNPLNVRVSSQQTRRATGATIFGVWIVAALFALPSGFSEFSCFICVIESCQIYYQRVVLFELLVSCVLPLCVIAFSYIMTARHLLKSARPISEGTQSPQLNTCTGTAKIVLGLGAIFLISFVPYHVYWTYIIFSKHPHSEIGIFFNIDAFKVQNPYAYIVSSCLLLINPCFNPVALFCTGRAFRRQFKRYLTCCCKENSTGTDIELPRKN